MHDAPDIRQRLSRRAAIRFATACALPLTIGRMPTIAQTPVAPSSRLEDLVIDLVGVPESIDPMLAYSPTDWSIVHAIYDAPLGIAQDGSVQPLLGISA